MVKSNSYQKGNKYELEAKKTLENDGWLVFKQHRKPVYMKGRLIMMGCDIFGCDIVAKKLGFKPRWIQVSTEDNLHKKIIQIKEFPWNFQYEEAEVWCRVTGKREFKVYHGPEFRDPTIVEVNDEK